MNIKNKIGKMVEQPRASSESLSNSHRPRWRVKLAPPPRGLSPNARVCWQVRAALVKAYRMAAWAAAREAIGRREAPQLPRARVQAIFHVLTARRRDGDNALAMLKPAFDGLADAGLLEDDSGIEHLPVCWVRDTRAYVELIIEGA